MPAFVIQFFLPLMTHSSPSGTAVVRIAAGSEPASGSDSANAGDHSPVAQRGRKRCFCSSVPNSWIGSVPSSCTIRISAQAARRLRDLLDGHLQHQRAGAGAAVLLVERQREDVVLAEQLADVPRVLGLRVDLRGARRDPLLGDLAHGRPEVAQLLRDLVDAVARDAHALGY